MKPFLPSIALAFLVLGTLTVAKASEPTQTAECSVQGRAVIYSVFPKADGETYFTEKRVGVSPTAPVRVVHAESQTASRFLEDEIASEALEVAGVAQRGFTHAEIYDLVMTARSGITVAIYQFLDGNDVVGKAAYLVEGDRVSLRACYEHGF